MTVTADDGGSGEGESLLGADNVDNTLTLVTHTEIGEAEILHVFLEGGALQTGVVFFDEFVDILEVFAGGGRDVLEIQELGIADKWTRGEERMGHTWSTVTSVQSGRRTFLLAFLRPSKACYGGGQSGSWLGSGLVATATYWRSHLVDEMSVCRSVNFSFPLPENRT